MYTKSLNLKFAMFAQINKWFLITPNISFVCQRYLEDTYAKCRATAFDNVSHIKIQFVVQKNSFETIVETFKAHSKQLHLDDLKGSNLVLVPDTRGGI